MVETHIASGQDTGLGMSVESPYREEGEHDDETETKTEEFLDYHTPQYSLQFYHLEDYLYPPPPPENKRGSVGESMSERYTETFQGFRSTRKDSKSKE